MTLQDIGAKGAAMPLPSDPKVIFLGGLFVLALLATAYVASEIVLPLVFAIILKLLLQPMTRLWPARKPSVRRRRRTVCWFRFR